ncbi:HlyD family type I secretion periplasmic adaptor subunit [Hyphomicrobium sp. DY-1]|uniref:HlyD family type I secretion periplasmic adaptor subunit n=1 Tax=Hyphomicrobium sp. DY-1 TaxID=3075650 RepID=UPI0039C109AE
MLNRSIRQHLVWGGAALALLVGGFGAWAATSEISGAVIAPGVLVVDGNAKKVQHPTGGVIAELLVHEGQTVSEGDTVVRLDATITRANLSAITKKLNHLYARRARLEAERDGGANVGVPAELAARVSETDTAAIMADERRLFEDRRASREGQKDRLREQAAQYREQIKGLDVQQQAKAKEISLIAVELEGQRDLYKRGLTPFTRLNSLERDSARLDGERGQLIAQIASAKEKIAEIELQLLQVDQQMRADVASELRDVGNEIADSAEKEISAADQLQRIDIKAPASGIVHDLSVHTVGGVINPAETLMEIVPEKRKLTVECRIDPKDIDQLSVGQQTILRLTAFNRNTTPELDGKLLRVSADLDTDEKTGARFYRATIAIPDNELARIASLTLLPGMPAEAYIRTGERTVISYFMKPILDRRAQVFREE